MLHQDIPLSAQGTRSRGTDYHVSLLRPAAWKFQQTKVMQKILGIGYLRPALQPHRGTAREEFVYVADGIRSPGCRREQGKAELG